LTAVRSIAAIAAVLALAGCPPPPPPMGACGPPGNFTPADLVFGRVGQPLSVDLVVDQSCDDTVMMTVKVTVVDPNNLPVDVGEATRSVMPNSSGVRTTVQFTPTVAGPYHFVGKFEPNLGVAQTDVLVAADRSMEAPAFAVATSTTLGACTHLDVTPASRLLCLEPAVQLFEPDAGLVQTLPSQLAGYIDGTLWVLDPGGEVSRWVEDGGAGFVRTPDTSVLLNNPTGHRLLPTVDDVVLFDTGTFEVTRISASDAGLATTGDGVIASFGGQLNLAWHGGNDVVGLGTSNVCTFSFVADAGMPSCTFRNNVKMAGVDHQGVWDFDTTFGNVLTGFTSTRTSALDAPLGATLLGYTQSFLFESSPVLLLPDPTARPYAVSVDDHGFSLQAFGDGVTVKSVTSTAVTIQESSQLKVYRR
jgi:hypothetical protein